MTLLERFCVDISGSRVAECEEKEGLRSRVAECESLRWELGSFGKEQTAKPWWVFSFQLAVSKLKTENCYIAYALCFLFLINFSR